MHIARYLLTRKIFTIEVAGEPETRILDPL
jgi:hypothetical protein